MQDVLFAAGHFGVLNIDCKGVLPCGQGDWGLGAGDWGCGEVSRCALVGGS